MCYHWYWCFCIPNTPSQAHWALSHDNALQEIGLSTGIHYLNNFKEYLTILNTGLWQKKSIINIIRQWDKKVFADSESSLVKNKKSDEGSSLKKAMDLLAADLEEEDDQMEDYNRGGRANLDASASESPS